MKMHSNTCSVWFFLILFIANPSFAQEFAGPVLDPARDITEYVHASWGEQEGLPQGSINAIEQTDDGYVWLGTQEGLVRFDGIKFTVFDTHKVDALRGNDIRVLKRDHEGALWIGTLNAGIYRYFNGTFASATDHAYLQNARITAILAGKQGHVWVGTAEMGLYQFVHGEIIPIDLPTRNITALLETDEGTLWIGSRDAGLFRYENGTASAFRGVDGLPDEDVTSLAASQNGGIWIGTRGGGVAHLHNDTFYVATTEQGLPSNRIHTLFEDAAGSLWIGTDQAGLVRLRLEIPTFQTMEADASIRTSASTYGAITSVAMTPGSAVPGSVPNSSAITAWEDALRFSSFASPNGLTYDVVKSLFLDREGNLLIGTDGGGLNLLREGKFTMYTEKVGLPDDIVYAIHEDHFGAMWFSTEKGVGRLSKGIMSTYSTADGLADNYVISIASTPDSSVWMGTNGSGISRFYKGDFTTFTQELGLPENQIFGLHSDAKGQLWIGTGRGVARMNENNITSFTAKDGLSSNLVTFVLESRDGAVWVGTYDAGLNKVLGDEVVPFAGDKELATIGVLSLHEDKEGVLWIGTYGDGLIRVKDGGLTAYTIENGLFNDTILQVLEDDLGYLWMSSNRGLFRVDKTQLDDFASGKIKEITPVVYGKGDGLRSNEFNGGVQSAGWKSRDGKLWFPSTEGVAMIDPQRIQKNETPPLIQVEGLRADGESIPLEGAMELAAGTDRMEIHYAGLSLVAPKKIRYQYQLNGADREWVEAGSERIAHYTNLEPGAYSFKVRAQNSDGVWSHREAALSFYHKPFFYQTIWFYLMCLGVLITGIVSTVRWRTSQLRAQKVALEQEVHERTRNLEERTADLTSALEENKEILSITSHDLKNPLCGFIGLSEVLLEELSDIQPSPILEDGLESIQLMKDEAERMLYIVHELLDKHQVRKNDYHPHTFDLGRLIQDVIDRHKKNADQKNIRLIFDNSEVFQVVFKENAMLRIADNLISNAIKFSPPEKNVWVSLAIQRGKVKFTVRDEGPGLTEEDRKKVFGKLQRLSAQPTAGEQSTGWGLFIVKQLAEESGATVGVSSVHGEGASFWVNIPLYGAA
ncbi:MAG: two-component regulator propeller domain-containing protein [Rhodothermales bacterium]